MLRGIFGPKRDYVKGGWKKLHNGEVHKIRNIHKILVETPEAEIRTLRLEGNNKMGLKKMGAESVDWIQLAQGRDGW